MDTFFGQTADLLVSPPGNLAYHLVLAFSILGTFQFAFSRVQPDETQTRRRMLIGLGALLLLRLALFFAEGLAWSGVANPHLLLPPIDRTANLIALSLLIWLWAFPKPHLPADIATLLLIALAAGLGTLSLVVWLGQGGGGAFNATEIETGWTLFSVSLSALGIALLLLRRPAVWGYGLGMLALLLVGALAHWAAGPVEGDFSGAARLAILAAYPFLFALPQRVHMHEQRELHTSQPRISHPETITTSSPSVVAATPSDAFLSLAAAREPEEIYRYLTQAVAQSMHADICLLVSPVQGAEGQITVECGFDLIREKALEGGMFEGELLPRLNAFFQGGRAVRVQPKEAGRRAEELARYLGVEHLGSLLAVPVNTDGGHAAALLLLTPFSKYEWTREDQRKLEALAPQLAHVLARHEYEIRLREQLALANEQGEQASARAENLERENQAHRKRIEEVEDALERLQSENEELQASLKSTSSQEWNAYELEDKLTHALEQVADLKEELSQARRYIADLEAAGEDPTPQRMPDRPVRLVPETLNLSAVVDEAINRARPQLRKKGITLRVDITEGLPNVRTDRQSLLRIMVDLLANAGEASPPEGEITLRARQQSGGAGGESFALIQVTDLSEHESSYSLTAAKDLTQALGGRLWVKRGSPKGATTSLLLPLDHFHAFPGDAHT